MKKIITLIGAAFICLSSYSQWGGGFDFGGGGGASWELLAFSVLEFPQETKGAVAYDGDADSHG